MLKGDKTEERKSRHAVTQEDFTPNEIVEVMLDTFHEESYSNLDETFIDPACGNGNFLVSILNRKLVYCECVGDAYKALKSIYGVELMADNVEECRQRLYDTVTKAFPEILKQQDMVFKTRAIIRNRIQWYDSLKFDYNHWPSLSLKPRKGHEKVGFNEVKHLDDTKYPMWYKEPQKEVKQLELFSEKDYK